MKEATIMGTSLEVSLLSVAGIQVIDVTIVLLLMYHLTVVRYSMARSTLLKAARNAASASARGKPMAIMFSTASEGGAGPAGAAVAAGALQNEWGREDMLSELNSFIDQNDWNERTW